MLGENYRPKVWSFGLNIYRLFVLNINRLFIKYSFKLYNNLQETKGTYI